MTIIRILQFLCLFFWVFGDAFFKNVIDVVLSSSATRTTTWGNKLITKIETKTVEYFNAAADWKIAEKIQNTKRRMESFIGFCLSFLFVSAGFGGLVGIEDNKYWLNFLSLFVYGFMIALIIRYAIHWTTNHREAAKEFFKGFAFCAGFASLIILPFVNSFFILNPPNEGLPEMLILANSVYIFGVLIAGATMYALAWTFFGVPVAVSGAFMWTASKSAQYIVKNCDRDKVINGVTVLRFVKSLMPLAYFIITAVLIYLGVENPLFGGL